MLLNEYIPVNGKFFNRKPKEEQWYPLATRRPRLTLSHLNKMRKIRELRRAEQRWHKENLPKIYQSPDTDRKSKNK